MRYKALLDSFATSITVFIAMLMLFVSGGLLLAKLPVEYFGSRTIPNLLAAFTPLLIVGIGLLYAPQEYLIMEDAIVIKRAIGNIKLSISEIAVFSQIDALPRSIRLFGSGGFMGYFGLYYLAGHGRANLYCTNQNKLVLLKMKSGNTIVISPNQRDYFIDELRSKRLGHFWK